MSTLLYLVVAAGIIYLLQRIRILENRLQAEIRSGREFRENAYGLILKFQEWEGGDDLGRERERRPAREAARAEARGEVRAAKKRGGVAQQRALRR